MTVTGIFLSWLFLGPFYYCTPALLVFCSIKKRLSFGKISLFCGIYAQIMWIISLFLQNFFEVMEYVEYENRDVPLFLGFIAAVLFGFGANLLLGWLMNKSPNETSKPSLSPSTSGVVDDPDPIALVDPSKKNGSS